LDYGRDPEKLMDLSRSTLLFDDLYALKQWVLHVIWLCEQSNHIEKITLIDDIGQIFEAPRKWSWFRAFKMYVYTKEWWVFELQYNVKESYEAKTKWVSWVLWVINDLQFKNTEIAKIQEVITMLNTSNTENNDKDTSKEQGNRPSTHLDIVSWDFIFHIVRYFKAEERLWKESWQPGDYSYLSIIKKLQDLEKYIHESAWTNVMNNYKEVLKKHYPIFQKR
jgi:hypothetical protein